MAPTREAFRMVHKTADGTNETVTTLSVRRSRAVRKFRKLSRAYPKGSTWIAGGGNRETQPQGPTRGPNWNAAKRAEIVAIYGEPAWGDHKH